MSANAEKKVAALSFPRPDRVGHWSESALRVLRERYLLRNEAGEVIEAPEDMCWRVATAIAQGEANYRAHAEEIHAWAERFYDLMIERKFLPNSPTMMNAGKGNNLQYSACYVLPVGDSMIDIFDAIKNAALIHQSGGGTGFAFSRLRPAGTVVRSSGGKASGPVSFLRVFNAATEAVKQGGTRRGANMGILRVDHPDIEEFITCKLDGGITNFNISVAATDAFMRAVEEDSEYAILAQPGWPDQAGGHYQGGEVITRKRARDVFRKIVEAAWRTGDPGMVFIDRVNASPANPIPTLGQVEATNPCIAGDALVATDRGLLRMEDLVARYGYGGIAVQVDPRMAPAQFMVREATYDVPLAAYDQGCLPISQAFSSGERETVRVYTKAGFELVCTPDHRLMTQRGWVPASDLKIGMDQVLIQSCAGAFPTDLRLPFAVTNEVRGQNGRVYRHNLPETWSRELGIVLGWLVGDGWLRAGDKNCRVGFTFGGDDHDLLEQIKPYLDGWYNHPIRVVERARGVQHLSYHSKYFVEFFQNLGVKAVSADQKVVPESLFTAPREAVIGFLQGLFSADGTVRDHEHSNSSWVALTSKSRELLRGVQLLLLNLGIKSRILDRSRPPREAIFVYRTVDGEERSYGSDGTLFEIGIFGEARDQFRREVGFLNAKQQQLANVRFQRFYTQKFQDVVTAVEPNGVQRVYDLTEPQSHTMIANGIVIHQCGEQPLLPDEACNLGSVNLLELVKPGTHGPAGSNGHPSPRHTGVDWDELERVVRGSVRFLDDVIEVNPYPLPEIDQSVKANRRIGLGVMGWADMIFALGIPYDSQEALDLGHQVMGFINEIGHDESARLAEERGPFPNWSHSIYASGRPLRNSTVTTIAPTGTISIIAGASSGIEPIFALAFSHIVGERHLVFTNPVFERIARERGFYSEGLMRNVAETGTLHGVGGVPEEMRHVFVTAHEVTPEWHVRMQGAWQEHTDNGVSKTCNLPNQATVDEVADVYRLAFQVGCLGITVFRDGSKGVQVLHVGTKNTGKGATENEEEAKEALAQAVEEASQPAQLLQGQPSSDGYFHKKPRPSILYGTTYCQPTPLGTAYITVNANGGNQPFEVFLNVGKAGSDVAAVSEALGRLISLTLRLPSSLSPRERLEEVTEQLAGIGGGRPVGMGPNRVRSLPDAIAQVLSEYLSDVPPAREPSAAQLSLPLAPRARSGDLCPECGQGTLVFEEGCKKCASCGFSEC
jgi:ribonucleoside-diphosphate reductase alpha chain